MPNAPVDRVMPPRRVIHLVRHGESEANVAAIFDSGSIDAPLTDRGREQARRVGRWARGLGLTRIYTSPLRRARETADAVAALTLVPVVVEPLLAETRMGRWDGRRIREVVAEDGDAYRAWHEDPGTNPPPGGESMADLAARMQAALMRMAQATPAPFTLLAVSHGDPILALLLAAMAAPSHASSRVAVPNTVRLTLALDEAGRPALEAFGPVESTGGLAPA